MAYCDCIPTSDRYGGDDVFAGMSYGEQIHVSNHNFTKNGGREVLGRNWCLHRAQR
jgi:hypothetical protein